MLPQVPEGLARSLERVWAGWRGKREVHGLAHHPFVVDFPLQRHWNWKVAFYIYLAGTSAGLIFLEVVLRWLDLVSSSTAVWGMWIGLALAILSLVVLFDHLGPTARWSFYFAFRRPLRSWISRGAIIVASLVVLRLVALLPSVPGLGGLPWGEGSAAGNSLRVVVLLLALAFMAYSGLVLSSWNAIAFWNTPLLPALYVGHSFLGGMAALPIIALVTEGAGGAEEIGGVLLPYLLGLLLGTGSVLALYLYGMSTGTRPARVSVRLLTRGTVAWSFLLGVVGVGLVLPTVLVGVELGDLSGSAVTAASLLTVAGAAVQLGGYLLRDSVLRVGVYGPPV